MNTDAIKELVKSFGRYIYFGVLGLVGAWLTSLVASGALNNVKVTIAGTTVNAGVMLVAGIATVCKGIDRYIHENDDINRNGISPL